MRLQLTALGLIVISLLLAVFDVRCSSGAGGTVRVGDEGPDHESLVTAPGQLQVLTDVSDPDALRQVFDEVRDEWTEGHAWHVTIACAYQPDPDQADAVLANGRFANTQRGLARTGLADTDDVVFTTTGRGCTTDPVTVPGAVTPEQVIATVEAAGLGAPNPRDSSNFCAELGCVERTTTDAFTVTVWPDGDAAADWATATPLDVVRLGPATTVEFPTGRRQLPFPDDPTRDAYVAALAPLR